MVRAFIALELPAEIRDAVAETQELLRRCRARMTYVDPAQIHITVKFLGEVDDDKIPALMETVRKVSFSQFPVCVGRVTVNNPKRPFTVWCDVQDNGQGALLRHRIEDVLAPMGFMRESRPFTAHATVARIKQFDASLMEVLKNLSSRTFGECKITGMKLKKSTLTRTGPLYEDLLEVTW